MWNCQIESGYAPSGTRWSCPVLLGGTPAGGSRGKGHSSLPTSVTSPSSASLPQPKDYISQNPSGLPPASQSGSVVPSLLRVCDSQSASDPPALPAARFRTLNYDSLNPSNLPAVSQSGAVVSSSSKDCSAQSACESLLLSAVTPIPSWDSDYSSQKPSGLPPVSQPGSVVSSVSKDCTFLSTFDSPLLSIVTSVSPLDLDYSSQGTLGVPHVTLPDPVSLPVPQNPASSTTPSPTPASPVPSAHSHTPKDYMSQKTPHLHVTSFLRAPQPSAYAAPSRSLVRNPVFTLVSAFLLLLLMHYLSRNTLGYLFLASSLYCSPGSWFNQHSFTSEHFPVSHSSQVPV